MAITTTDQDPVIIPLQQGPGPIDPTLPTEIWWNFRQVTGDVSGGAIIWICVIRRLTGSPGPQVTNDVYSVENVSYQVNDGVTARTIEIDLAGFEFLQHGVSPVWRRFFPLTVSAGLAVGEFAGIPMQQFGLFPVQQRSGSALQLIFTDLNTNAVQYETMAWGYVWRGQAGNRGKLRRPNVV